jgi:hypothetical protein
MGWINRVAEAVRASRKLRVASGKRLAIQFCRTLRRRNTPLSGAPVIDPVMVTMS